MIRTMTHQAYLEMLTIADGMLATMHHLNRSDDSTLCGSTTTYGVMDAAVLGILSQAFGISDSEAIRNVAMDDICGVHSAIQYVAWSHMAEALRVAMLIERYAEKAPVTTNIKSAIAHDISTSGLSGDSQDLWDAIQEAKANIPETEGLTDEQIAEVIDDVVGTGTKFQDLLQEYLSERYAL